MKQLELELQKKLLIVEFEDTEHLESVISCNNIGIRFMSDNEDPAKIICKGSEFTEEVAKERIHQSIHTGLFAYYVEGIPVNVYCYKTALESFISAIEAKGYYWGKHNVKSPIIENYGYHDNINILDTPPEWDEQCYFEDLDLWQDAESRTFHLDKTLIFEIP
ncbi:hypothetical protein ACMGDK_11265 [Chryseobacterium sp. DT-3]|uniref:hypothetical protein n=1 Tax=Chryseobacterium sp. DT-3 TaxID=3396164 RepID=UPI003F1D6510